MALVLAASGCDKDRARNEPDAQALAELRAIAEEVALEGAGVVSPSIPDEPPPSKPELAHEVPDILAELEADPAYRGIWEPARREDLDVVLSGMSAILTESPVPKALVDAIKERQLERVISRPMAIRNRIGKLPDAFADRLRAHLAATKDEPQLGLWLTPAGGRIRDYAAVAVYVEPNKPEYLRELVAARTAGVGQWTPLDENPARPWLATERGVLERLSALTTLTAAEQHRIDELRGELASRGGDATTVANDLGAGAVGTKHIGLIAERYGVHAPAVGDKAAKTAELCMGGADRVAAKPARAVELVRASLAFVEGVSRTDAERKMLPLDDAFVTFVTMGCPAG